MTRTSYLAPGVYVEEVRSARQPIAGVGTNTVAFIGRIPEDFVWVPVANPKYDPVAAQVLFDFRASGGSDSRAILETRMKDLDTEIEKLKKSVDDRRKDLDAKKKAIADLEKVPADGQPVPAPAALTRARDAVTRAERSAANAETELGSKTADRAELAKQLGQPGGDSVGNGKADAKPGDAGKVAGDGGGGQPPPDPDLTYDETPPPEEYQRPSLFRPYYFEKVAVEGKEFETKLCTNFSEYARRFGGFSAFDPKPINPDDPAPDWKFRPLHPGHHYLTQAVSGFFTNGGTRCFVARVKSADGDSLRKVLARFSSIDDVAIIATPGLPKLEDFWGPIQDYCEDNAHQNVFAILDCPKHVDDVEDDAKVKHSESSQFDITLLQYSNPDRALPRTSNHSAFYFPWIEVSDSAKQLQDTDLERRVHPKYRGHTYVPPSGHMAGIYARTDEERGVHKAPANAVVRGALGVRYFVSKPMQEMLNPQGVNCIRMMNGAITVWGARTMGGDINGEWKYISVRRFAGFLEASIDRGTQWVVFEPNDPNLWSRIILNITAFLTNVWRSGALFGLTPQEAFYVKCDAELNPPEVRDLGQVITEIGVSIVRPAEFVIFRITQSTAAAKS